MKILVFGSTGYVGEAFKKFLSKHNIKYACASIRYPYDRRLIRDKILNDNITHVVNCAGYTGKPNVDTCEDEKDQCLYANAYFPKILAEVCKSYNIPMLHVSSGCIYNDVNCEQGLPPLIEYPEHFKPNFSFDTGNCSWYSGTKALGEELLINQNTWPTPLICRLRIPFNGEVNHRNYIDKIVKYPTLLNATNSFSQLDEFVSGCFHLLQMGAEGVYNLTQPGHMTTKQVVNMLRDYGVIKSKTFFDSITEFNKHVKAPRSNCVLDSSSAIRTGVKLTPIATAMEEAIKQYANNLKQ